MTERFVITDRALDAAALTRQVADDRAGALVLFHGVVRSEHRGRAVRFLEYEAYPGMAIVQMARIADDLAASRGLCALSCHHRVGRLEIGETAVIIAVSAPHRAEAFEGCREFLDRLKRDVPIWKKEFYQDGAAWIGAAHSPHDGGAEGGE